MTGRRRTGPGPTGLPAEKGSVPGQQFLVDTMAMTPPAEYTDPEDDSRTVLGKSGVRTSAGQRKERR
ncbi:hypothetical protein [Streptosporangium sp. NBC_01469]|uniref:hypothetical protein n=1 Tax=Streptosporangium sp. NBC_01469 TaxID=2903898 RepID=UPI002E2CD5D8|nr:hypothetical protein [Streptosporangium sp. NBC_01469]